MLKELQLLAEKKPNDQEFGQAVREFLTMKSLEFGNWVTTFREYTDFVRSMKAYPEKHAIVYPIIGLSDEAGECAGKVKKWLRGDSELDVMALMKELGDPLWYIASAADDLGFTLQDVVNINMEKLTSRKERGVLKGDGDNR